MVNIITTLTMSLANIAVGVVELLIGLLMGESTSNQDTNIYKNVFLILFFISILSSTTLFLKIYFE